MAFGALMLGNHIVIYKQHYKKGQNEVGATLLLPSWCINNRNELNKQGLTKGYKVK